MLTDLIRSLSFKWDIVTGRYDSFLVQLPEYVQACIDVLEAVRRKELNRVSGDSVVQSGAFGSRDIDFQLIACRDNKTEKIIGCMRLTDAGAAGNVPSSREEYLLDLFDPGMIEKIKIFTRLAVLPAYRKTPAALVIMICAFKTALQQGANAIVMSCEPSLFKMYKRLGLRPLGPLHNAPSGGYRIPMICIPDIEYFKLIRTPALPFLQDIEWAQYEQIKEWYLRLIREKGEIETGASLYDVDMLEHEDHWPITQGLSEKSLKRFLKNAITVKCAEGDLLIAKKDGGKFVGIIREGFGKVQVDGKTIALLSKGDIFGEMAYILEQYRSANVVAGDSDTEVLLFNVFHLKKVATDTERMIIWRNMAKILAKRLIDSHQRIYGDEVASEDA